MGVMQMKLVVDPCPLVMGVMQRKGLLGVCVCNSTSACLYKGLGAFVLDGLVRTNTIQTSFLFQSASLSTRTGRPPLIYLKFGKQTSPSSHLLGCSLFNQT